MIVKAAILLMAFPLVEAAFSPKEHLRKEKRKQGRRLADGGELTVADKQALLNAHNTHRGDTALGKTGTQPMATNMLEMVWDDDLAISSKAHVDQCVFQHSTGPYGENIYAAASFADNVDNIGKLVSGVENWVDEYEFFNFTENDCDDGKVCGHYTQVVWASSARMGCGYAECGPFPDTYFQVMLVCQYTPPGNYIGVIPYTSTSNDTDVASECPVGYYSDSASGLCKVESVTTTSPTASPVASPLSTYVSKIALRIIEKVGKWKPILKLLLQDTSGSNVSNVVISYTYTVENNPSISNTCTTNDGGVCVIKNGFLASEVNSVTVVLDSVTAPSANYNSELNFVHNGCPVFSSSCEEYEILKP